MAGAIERLRVADDTPLGFRPQRTINSSVNHRLSGAGVRRISAVHSAQRERRLWPSNSNWASGRFLGSAAAQTTATSRRPTTAVGRDLSIAGHLICSDSVHQIKPRFLHIKIPLDKQPTRLATRRRQPTARLTLPWQPVGLNPAGCKMSGCGPYFPGFPRE